MSCYHVASDQPRMIRDRHADCPPPPPEWHPPLVLTCAGCQPCERPHCLLQWHGDRGECQTHAESVCPSCLGKVREHLDEIVRLAGLPLLEQVLAKGSANTEAADLLGPTAEPAQWRQRGDHGHRYEPDSRIGELHPLWVLGTWDLLVTEHLGHKRTQRAGVRSSAAYIGLNLAFLAADMEFDFPVLADELADCRAHLERVLHDGEQREKAAPCLKCGKAIQRSVDDKGRVTYRCKGCRAETNDAGYLMAQRADRLAKAEMLTADDMATRTNVPASTIRRWGNARHINGVDYAPLFRSPGRNGQGRKVYRVADVERVRDSGGDTRGSNTNAGASAIVSNEGAA